MVTENCWLLVLVKLNISIFNFLKTKKPEMKRNFASPKDLKRSEVKRKRASVVRSVVRQYIIRWVAPNKSHHLCYCAGLFVMAPLQKLMEHLLMRTANHCHDAKKPSMPVSKYRHAGLFWPANAIYCTNSKLVLDSNEKRWEYRPSSSGRNEFLRLL